MRLTNLSFEEWIEHAFSREAHIQQAAWYFDPNQDWWDPKPVKAVAYLARLFEDAERTLCWVSGSTTTRVGLIGLTSGRDQAARRARFWSAQVHGSSSSSFCIGQPLTSLARVSAR